MAASWRSVCVLALMACGAAITAARVPYAAAQATGAGLADEAELAELVAGLQRPELAALPLLVLSTDSALAVRLRHELYPRTLRDFPQGAAERLDRALVDRRTLVVVPLGAPAATVLAALQGRLPGRPLREVHRTRGLLVVEVGA
jgi:hypothetical protein